MIRPILLPLISGAVMVTVLLLPEAGKIAESAIRMDLPEKQGDWELIVQTASKKEVDILDKETQFSKAVCIAPIPYSYEADGSRKRKRIDLSIVLSGTDINNSIHRPERCMPAQGHQIYDSSVSSITTQTGKAFPARELISLQEIPLDEKGEKVVKLHCFTMYFFVGQREITEDHLQRTLIDMKDRLLRGQDQRWAYVSASMWFAKDGEFGLMSRADAEKEIRQFLSDLADRNINWEKVLPNSSSL